MHIRILLNSLQLILIPLPIFPLVPSLLSMTNEISVDPSMLHTPIILRHLSSLQVKIFRISLCLTLALSFDIVIYDR